MCCRRPPKKGLVATCEVCAPVKVIQTDRYKALNREVVNETNRLWGVNLRAGLPTTEARRAQMIKRAEVDSG